MNVCFAKGRCIKLDFENGTLRGWHKLALGTAFDNQPTYGDNPRARGSQPANQQGNWSIGTYENRSRSHDSPGKYQGKK